MATLSEAGLGFDTGLARILETKLGDHPLAREFRSYQADLLGRPSRIDALRRFARRLEVASISILVSALVQAEQLGTGIAQVLRRQADDLRSRRRERANAFAMTLPVKRMFPLVICFLPGIFVWPLGPASRSSSRWPTRCCKDSDRQRQRLDRLRVPLNDLDSGSPSRVKEVLASLLSGYVRAAGPNARTLPARSRRCADARPRFPSSAAFLPRDLLEHHIRPDAGLHEPLDQLAVVDVPVAEGLAPNIARGLPQVQLRNARPVEFHNVEQCHLGMAGAAVDPVGVQARLSTWGSVASIM